MAGEVRGHYNGLEFDSAPKSQVSQDQWSWRPRCHLQAPDNGDKVQREDACREPW